MRSGGSRGREALDMEASSAAGASCLESKRSDADSTDDRPWWERMGPVELWLAAGFLLWLSFIDFNQTSLSNSLCHARPEALAYFLKHHAPAPHGVRFP